MKLERVRDGQRMVEREKAVGVKYKAFQDRNTSSRLNMTKSEGN